MQFPSPALAAPPFVGCLVDEVQLRGVEDVHLHGDHAFLPCREGKRLTVCSISDPANLTILGSFTHADLDEAAGFALNGKTAYVASHGNHMLHVIDVSDPAAMKLVGSVVVGSGATTGWLYKVAYRDGFCYVASQKGKRLFVVDVREPSRPDVTAEVAVTSDDDGPFSVELRGPHALVGTLFGKVNRLAVVDIHDPAKPVLAGALIAPDVGHMSGAQRDDRYIAVNWDRNALFSVDLSDATAPRIEGKLVDERLGKPNRCAVVGDRAYLPMVKGDGVAVVDISDPKLPRFVTAFRDPVMKKTYGIAARGDLLFVGSREGNSLVVLDRRLLEK